jgi:predicted alpha/beta superfamily hydrolase
VGLPRFLHPSWLAELDCQRGEDLAGTRKSLDSPWQDSTIMEEIKRFQLRGIDGEVKRVRISGRIVDYWAPPGGSDSLLIAHDGQNIFDWRTASSFKTWRLAQNATRVAVELNQKPPLIVAVFHGKSKADPHGRARDLCPEDAFRDGVTPSQTPAIEVSQLRGNSYTAKIFEEILPTILQESRSQVSPERSAMIGSSMGGLATLYSLINYGSRFKTALSLSTHWSLAGTPLVEWLISRLPSSGEHRIWMSRGERGYDAEYPPFQKQADKKLIEAGWQDNFVSKVFKGAGHNERAWASQVNEPLRFWLSKL